MTPTSIPGALRTRVKVHADERGSFGELWRRSLTEPLGLDFVQANLSRSRAGVLRGLHFHQRQWDMWIVLGGRAHVALVDLRGRLAGSDAPPVTFSEVLADGDAVLIPVGVAHGFWALEALDLLYLVTNEYDGTDEHGFAWNDQLAGVTWPPGTPILSDRDAAAPTLEEALARAR